MFDLSQLDVGDAMRFTGLALEGATTIAQLTGSRTLATAIPILSGVQTVLGLLKDAFAGRVDPDAARAGFVKLRTDLAQQDAEADAALAARFSGTTDTIQLGRTEQAVVLADDGGALVVKTPDAKKTDPDDGTPSAA